MSKLERNLIVIVVAVALSMAWTRIQHIRGASASQASALVAQHAAGTNQTSFGSLAFAAKHATPAQTASPAANQGVDAAARFVTHREHIQPGNVTPPNGLALKNPYAGNASAAASGAKLFISYNCADCHGAEGSGFMAPTLQDGRWHFGGSDAELFESIFEGRPDGMPAWGSLISQDQIWLLVSYVRTLQQNRDVTTENFTGRTVERMGH